RPTSDSSSLSLHDALPIFLAGGADAVIADNTIVEYYTQMNPEQKLKVVPDEDFADEFYGILFPKGSELKADFDEAIKAIIDNGTDRKSTRLNSSHVKISYA